MAIMGLTEWDGCDFWVNDNQVAINSTKYFGNLLLLETRDWDQQHDNYDYFVLIRIKPDGSSIMKSNRWLYSDAVDYDTLKIEILNADWQCDIVGYITHNELVEIITYYLKIQC